MNCIKCQDPKKKIYNYKRRMCYKCYYLWYRNKNKGNIKQHYLDKIFHLKEVKFIKNFFTHKNWIYQPANFRLNNTRYSPDFYDGERNVFIEVAGTHGAFYHNREKYHLFIETYPQIKFEVRLDNGLLIPLSSDIKGIYPSEKKIVEMSKIPK